MANEVPFQRSARRIFARIGTESTISPDISETGTFQAILDKDVTKIELPGGFMQQTEPHDEVEILQADFIEKPRRSEHIFTINGADYEIADNVNKDDGIVWRFIVMELN